MGDTPIRRHTDTWVHGCPACRGLYMLACRSPSLALGGSSSRWPGAGAGGGAASGQAGARRLLAEAPRVSQREADGLEGGWGRC